MTTADAKPWRKITNWFSQLAVIQKVILIGGPLLIWLLSRIRTEPTQFPGLPFNRWWLLVAVASTVAIILLGWRLKRRHRPAQPHQPDLANSPDRRSNGQADRPKHGRTFLGYAVALIVLGLLIAWILWLIFWGQIFSAVKPHAHNFFVRHGISTYGGKIIGDGGAPGEKTAQVQKLEPGYYRLFIPADTDWDPTRAFWPGDRLEITVEQPFYRRRESSDPQNTVAGYPYQGRLVTPRDLAPGQAKFYTDQTMPLGGLLLKAGRGGLPKFCGQGGPYTVPGGLCWPGANCRQTLYFAINVGQEPAQRVLLEGTIVITIRVVHSNHPID